MFNNYNFKEMSQFFAFFIVIVAVLSLFVFGLGFKMIFDKNAEFKGGCASNNPMLRNEIGECTVCGRIPDNDECDTIIETNELPKIG